MVFGEAPKLTEGRWRKIPDPCRVNLFKKEIKKYSTCKSLVKKIKEKPQNMPQAEEDRPLEAVPQEAERNPQPSEEGKPGSRRKP